MGYHKTNIDKGVLGQFSKITEEYQEAKDSQEQNNPIMTLLELSDLIGAIEAYANSYNLSLQDIISMKNATKSAFESGRRR